YQGQSPGALLPSALRPRGRDSTAVPIYNRRAGPDQGGDKKDANRDRDNMQPVVCQKFILMNLHQSKKPGKYKSPEKNKGYQGTCPICIIRKKQGLDETG